MKTALSLWVGIWLMVLAGNAGAVTIYECEDEHGNRSFQQVCPPGTTQVESRNFYTGPRETGPDLAALKRESPVVLYSVPTCDACDLTRHYLTERGIPFTEKNVSDDIALQEELLQKTGELSVPVVLVGDNQIPGYNRPLLENELSAAGYPERVTDEMVEAAAAAEPEPEPEPQPLPRFDPIDPDTVAEPGTIATQPDTPPDNILD